MTSISQLDEDEIPTAKTCPECKGEGFVVVERAAGHYRGEPCKWCGGHGRVPISQQMKAVK